MTGIRSSKPSIENVSDIVSKTNLFAEQLKLAVIRQDNLTKDCFEKFISKEHDKNIKGKCSKRQNDALKEGTKTGEHHLNEILEDCGTGDENICSKDTITGMANRKDVNIEDKKMAENLKDKIRTLKQLTGVRFDVNIPGNTLTGYIGISSNKPYKSTFVPFEFDKSNSNLENLIWKKISQACSEIDMSN